MWRLFVCLSTKLRYGSKEALILWDLYDHLRAPLFRLVLFILQLVAAMRMGHLADRKQRYAVNRVVGDFNEWYDNRYRHTNRLIG